MTTMASQITSITVVYSTVYSDADQRNHQSSASLAFVWGIHRDRWIARQRVSYAENVSIWWRHHASLSNLTSLSDAEVSVKWQAFQLPRYLRNCRVVWEFEYLISRLRNLRDLVLKRLTTLWHSHFVLMYDVPVWFSTCPLIHVSVGEWTS